MLSADLDPPNDLADEDFSLRATSYIDGEATEAERLAFEAFLEAFPERAQQFAMLREIEAAVRTIGSSIDNEPIPEHLLAIVRRLSS